MTLYAEWTPVENKTYRITYRNIEGWDNSKNPATYSFEKDVKLVNPTLTGYTFKGWYAEDLTVNPKAKKITKIARTTCKDMTVYGLWSENTYNLRFSTGGLTSSVKAIANKRYTAAITIPKTVLEKAGCTFKGWAITRGGEALYQPGAQLTLAQLHAAGGTAKGLIGTKYFTLYAVFE